MYNYVYLIYVFVNFLDGPPYNNFFELPPQVGHLQKTSSMAMVEGI